MRGCLAIPVISMLAPEFITVDVALCVSETNTAILVCLVACYTSPTRRYNKLTLSFESHHQSRISRIRAHRHSILKSRPGHLDCFTCEMPLLRRTASARMSLPFSLGENLRHCIYCSRISSVSAHAGHLSGEECMKTISVGQMTCFWSP